MCPERVSLFAGGWVIKAITARQFRLAAGCLALLILTSGCASLGISGLGDGGVRKAPPLRIERSEAPAHYDVLVAEFAKLDGDFEAARAAFERAAEKDPDSAVIHSSLATLAWRLEDVPGAVREAERAFELDPDSVPIRLFLGRLYRLQRDIDGLNRVLRDEDSRPLDADSTYVLYQVAFERGDLEEAERLARDLSNSEPDQLRGTLALATVYEQRAEFDAAETIVREALETFPDHFLLFMRLAEIERARGNRDGEIAVYREVLAIHPGHYGILQRLGQAQVGGVEHGLLVVLAERFQAVEVDHQLRRHQAERQLEVDQERPLRQLLSIFKSSPAEFSVRTIKSHLPVSEPPEKEPAISPIRLVTDFPAFLGIPGAKRCDSTRVTTGMLLFCRRSLRCSCRSGCAGRNKYSLVNSPDPA